MSDTNIQNDDLDPKTTTLNEDDYYALICEVAHYETNYPDSSMDRSDASPWGCRKMAEYRKHHGQRQKQPA